MEISVIHPSRQRPSISFLNLKKWVERSDIDCVEYIISLDSDDPTLKEYLKNYESFRAPHRILINPNTSSVQAINIAAKESTGRVLMVVSDDTSCPINWGRRILKYTDKKEDFVLKVMDGFQTRIITQPILDRVYFNRDGYIYHPRFQHLFCDTYFTDVAFKRKRVISKNITFPHLQYSILKTEPDATYKKNNQTYESGKKTYLELRRTI